MNKSSSYKIYNASAGSGKTFNLVREYLIKIFASDSKLAFRQILALTFTNKAVGEMKERILKMLQEFSSENILSEPTNMFKILQKDLGLTSKELHAKSKSILKTILHNYAAFDVSTIDKFNHRLIRTFSSDLKLPSNFEVELDVDTILAKAVDKLIDKAGVDREITDLLIDFSLQKIDEDKSWDVSYDLNQIAKTIKKDEDKFFVDLLKHKSLKDFKNLEKNLKSKISKAESFLVEGSNQLLNKLEENDLLTGVFNRNTLPNHFRKINKLELNNLYGNKLEANLESNTSIYVKSADELKKQLVEELVPEIKAKFLLFKSKVHEILFLQNALRHLTPLSVLHEINLCLQEIKAEEGLVLISDFNSIIYNEIKKQPAPYIYERLGERYRDYFIDEFQDTSVLQWQNLDPLIENAVSQENLAGKRGSVTLVGDGKQAIYRWRGGKPEQFVNLYNNIDNPFTIEPEILNLENNFRSKKTIVDFNNKFFRFVSENVFADDLHSSLFQQSKQTPQSEEEGYLEIQFLDEEKDELDEAFAQRTLQVVQNVKDDGYALKDICILTRTNMEGASIARFLSENGIEIISSETLMLSSSPKVNFTISVLKALVQANDKEAKIELLSFLFKSNKEIKDQHSFYVEHLVENNSNFFDKLKSYGYNFSAENIGNLPLYELVEQIVRGFNLNEHSDAYVQFLLDEVYQFSQRANYGIKNFLEHWETKKDSLSVVNPEGADAVRIMSIHKSKGLEFPIVIFPYASRKIYDDRGSKIWYEVNPDEFSGFQHLYISLNKDLQHLNHKAHDIYNNHRAQLELDSLNLLYVTMTRPQDRLYILSQNDVPEKRSGGYTKFSELYVDFLQRENIYEDGNLIHQIGRKVEKKSGEKAEPKLDAIEMISTPREAINLNILTKQGRLWDTDRKQAIEKGNLLHHILSLIDLRGDVDRVFSDLIKSGEIEEVQQHTLRNEIYSIINHKKLSDYYTNNWTVLNEREIISKDGELHRPDRIMVNNNKEAVVIDYKSGAIEPRHKNQIAIYAKLLQEMDYKIFAKYLVYIGSTIEILEI